jgi:hypothetical protein
MSWRVGGSNGGGDRELNISTELGGWMAWVTGNWTSAQSWGVVLCGWQGMEHQHTTGELFLCHIVKCTSVQRLAYTLWSLAILCCLHLLAIAGSHVDSLHWTDQKVRKNMGNLAYYRRVQNGLWRVGIQSNTRKIFRIRTFLRLEGAVSTPVNKPDVRILGTS